MRFRVLIAAVFALLGSVTLANAQGCGTANPNCVVSTRPAGDSSNAAASTAFIQQNAASYFNVLGYGADPGGVNTNFGAAFNAAMTACVAAGPLGIALNGTVYIPKGFYKLGTTVMNWKQGCNIVADHAAYIQANTSVTNLLTSGTGAGNTLQEVYLEGGQWDCNANVTKDAWAIPDFARITLHHARLYNCSGNAGNGSIGGFIRLAGAGTTQSNGAYLHHLYLYSFTGQVASLVSGNYGVFSDPSSTGGPTDSRFEDIEVAGVSIGFQGVFFDGIFSRNHAFVFSTQGNLVNGFKLTSGQIRLDHNQVDGPLVSANAAYDLSGSGPYTLQSNGFFEATNNNVSNAVNVASGTTVISSGNHWIGNSGSNKILTDYTGTLTGLTVLQDYTQNVSTVVGGAWKTYTPSPSCGTATFTVNSAHANVLAKTTTVELDITVSAIGTCTTQGVSFTLPNTPSTSAGMVGRDSVSSAGNIVCSIATGSTTVFCAPAASLTGTSRLVLSGVYENQ